PKTAPMSTQDTRSSGKGQGDRLVCSVARRQLLPDPRGKFAPDRAPAAGRPGRRSRAREGCAREGAPYYRAASSAERSKKTSFLVMRPSRKVTVQTPSHFTTVSPVGITACQ